MMKDIRIQTIALGFMFGEIIWYIQITFTEFGHRAPVSPINSVDSHLHTTEGRRNTKLNRNKSGLLTPRVN